MDTFTSLLIKQKRNRKKYFSQSERYAEMIREKSKNYLDRVEVFLFGSALENKATPQSDIDVIICSPNLPQKQSEKALLVNKITAGFGLYHPFELHLVDKEGLDWYKRFADLKKIE